MYHIRQVGFGYVLTLEGAVQASEMKAWFEGTRRQLRQAAGSFGVLVDARRCHPLPKLARFWLLRGQSVCEEAGLERAAVLVDSAAQDGYWPALSHAPAPARRVRFVDAADHYPRMRALGWILKGVEPNVNEGVRAPDGAVAGPVIDESALLEAARW